MSAAARRRNPVPALSRLPEDLVIHVALASVYPTEAEARAALADEGNYAPDYARFAASDAPYLGIWLMAEPHRTAVHVFTDVTAEDLKTAGWTRDGTQDCLCPGEIPHPERGMQPGAAAGACPNYYSDNVTQ